MSWIRTRGLQYSYINIPHIKLTKNTPEQYTNNTINKIKQRGIEKKKKKEKKR